MKKYKTTLIYDAQELLKTSLILYFSYLCLFLIRSHITLMNSCNARNYVKRFGQTFSVIFMYITKNVWPSIKMRFLNVFGVCFCAKYN